MTTFPRREAARVAAQQARVETDIEKLNAAAADDPAELLVDVPAGELYLHGRIGEPDITAKAVSAALKRFQGKPVRLYINSPGGSCTEGVSVYNAQGEKIQQIDVPENWSANVCFGGQDRDRLFITASDSLYSIQMQTKGLK